MASKDSSDSSFFANTMNRRGFIASALGTAGFGAIGARLLYLQGFDPNGRAEQAKISRTRTTVVPALRGEILDINGNVLARSVQRYNVTVDQTAVADYDLYDENRQKVTVTATELVYKLADLLGMKDTEVKQALDGDKKYKVIKEDVTPETYNKVVDLGAPFIYGEVISDRFYPNGSVGGSIVGRYSMIEEATGDGDGTVLKDYSIGIERVYTKQLSGIDGSRNYEISADGIRIPVGEEQVIPAVNGQNVRLTINQDIQFFAQQVVKARVDATKAEWGTAVVMRISDASILALADSSTMDPGSDKFEAADMTPRAISMAVEPGSTEKMLTATAAMEQGITNPYTVFDVPAELEIDGQTITDAFVHPAQRRTFSGIISDSMNTGTVIVGKQLSREERYSWLRKYGMGQYTGIELTGENQGLLNDWRDWDIRQQYTVLFGQGVSQTPLQTAMIYQTIGNLGIKLKPRIVDALIDSEGNETILPVEEGQRLISEATAREALELMENVVHDHAPDAAVTGYRVGGKTGTAEAPSETEAGYDGFTTSFVGVAPIEDPQYLVGVTLQRPEGAVYEIGATAQFSQIMEKVLHTYNVPFSTTEPVLIPKLESELTAEQKALGEKK